MASSWAETLHGAFQRHEAGEALFIGGQGYSYGDLWRAAIAYGAELERATPVGARVGVMAQRSPEAFAAILGCVLAGRPYVPINPKLPRERQAKVARIAACAALAPDEASASAAHEIGAEGSGTPVLRPAPIRSQANGSALPSPQEIADTRHMYVMFTSGTTGEPKGVAVRRENVASYVSALRRFVEVRPGERCSQFFDLSFDLSVHDMFVTWASGGSLCVPTEAEMVDPVGFAARTGVSIWFSVPSVIALARRFRRLKANALPGVRVSQFCGEPLPTSLANEWAQAAPNAEIWNLYGPTEATIAITAHRYEPAQSPDFPASVPLGVAYENCAAVVVNSEGEPAGPGEVGELWLGGAQITDGYINAPQEKALKFVRCTVPGYPFGEWYRSGDLVKNDSRFGLVFQSRLDDQVKISGYRVELLEIEEALRKAAETPDVAAVPWPLAEGGASAEGVVGFACGADKPERDIIEACRKQLPAYMVPRKILFPAEMPLNANGKVDRKALRSRYLEAGA